MLSHKVESPVEFISVCCTETFFFPQQVSDLAPPTFFIKSPQGSHTCTHDNMTARHLQRDDATKSRPPAERQRQRLSFWPFCSRCLMCKHVDAASGPPAPADERVGDSEGLCIIQGMRGSCCCWNAPQGQRNNKLEWSWVCAHTHTLEHLSSLLGDYFQIKQ